MGLAMIQRIQKDIIPQSGLKQYLFSELVKKSIDILQCMLQCYIVTKKVTGTAALIVGIIHFS